MAKKISELTTYEGTPTSSSVDVIPAVQNGTTKKISLGNILTAASSGGGGGTGKEPGTISVYYTNITNKNVSNATVLPETVYDGCIVHVLRPMGPDIVGYTTCTNLILPTHLCLDGGQTFILRLENSNPNDSAATTINVYTPDLSGHSCTKLCTVNFYDDQQHVILVSKRIAYNTASTMYDFTYLGPYNNMAHIWKSQNSKNYSYKNGVYLSITELEKDNITLNDLADVVKGYRNTSFMVDITYTNGVYNTTGLMHRSQGGSNTGSYDDVNILVLDSDGTWKNISTM